MHTGLKGFESKCGYITSAWRSECLRGGRRDKLVKDQGRGEKLIREVHRRRKKVESYSKKRVKKQGSTFRRDVDSFQRKNLNLSMVTGLCPGSNGSWSNTESSNYFLSQTGRSKRMPRPVWKHAAREGEVTGSPIGDCTHINLWRKVIWRRVLSW